MYQQLHRRQMTNAGHVEEIGGRETAREKAQKYVLVCVDGEIFCAVRLEIKNLSTTTSVRTNIIMHMRTKYFLRENSNQTN